MLSGNSCIFSQAAARLLVISNLDNKTGVVVVVEGEQPIPSRLAGLLLHRPALSLEGVLPWLQSPCPPGGRYML